MPRGLTPQEAEDLVQTMYATQQLEYRGLGIKVVGVAVSEVPKGVAFIETRPGSINIPSTRVLWDVTDITGVRRITIIR